MNPLPILIVDDDPDLREIIEYCLTPLGRTIVVADGGESAWALIQAQPFAVVVSDMSMPGINGLELLRLIREKGLETPFFLLTGYSDNEHNAKAKALRASGLLEKPFKEAEIRAAVSKVL